MFIRDSAPPVTGPLVGILRFSSEPWNELGKGEISGKEIQLWPKHYFWAFEAPGADIQYDAIICSNLNS